VGPGPWRYDGWGWGLGPGPGSDGTFGFGLGLDATVTVSTGSPQAVGPAGVFAVSPEYEATQPYVPGWDTTYEGDA
jgi:hypothetical protein